MIGNIVSDIPNTSSICTKIYLASEAGSNVWFYEGNTVCKQIFLGSKFIFLCDVIFRRSDLEKMSGNRQIRAFQNV